MVTLLKSFLSGVLALSTGVLGVGTMNAKPADAQMLIGGGGTCAPHQVFYQKYVPGYYNSNGVWMGSHYESRSKMSTECNSFNPAPPNLGSNLAGAWYTDANFSGATTHIAQTGFNTYRFINEQGSVANGYAFGNQVVAPRWGVTGVLENGGNRIAWSNGTDWTRYGL